MARWRRIIAKLTVNQIAYSFTAIAKNGDFTGAAKPETIKKDDGKGVKAVTIRNHRTRRVGCAPTFTSTFKFICPRTARKKPI
jgi:hypothetical protein